MSAPATAAASPLTSPWGSWGRHMITGTVAIVTGLALIHYGQLAMGSAAVGGGLGFLGVGVGVAAGTGTKA